ncbi:hypothetical protein FQN54_006171 [Arachnomyces sp. PD_36]|nr:hypothetical protein FQN54_006171 [Arachnomyces sp. PD_36]
MGDVETLPTDPSERRRIQNRNAQRKYRHKRNLDRVYNARGDPPRQSQSHSQSLMGGQQQVPSSSSSGNRSNNPWASVDLSQPRPTDFLQEPCDQSINLSHVAAGFGSDNSSGDNGNIFEAGDPNHVYDSGYSSSVPNLSSLSSISESQSLQGLTMASLSNTPGGFLEGLNFSLAAAAASDPMDLNHSGPNSHANTPSNSPNQSTHSHDMMLTNHNHNPNSTSSNELSPSNPNLSALPSDTANQADWISMLHIASVRGHAHMVSALLEHPISIDERDSSGRTPLHLATANGHPEVVSLLLSRGADINLEDTLGRTALHWTALQKHSELLRILIQRGADVNIIDHNGWSALHVCVERGWEEGFRVLIGRGADLNLRAKKCEVWKSQEPDF